MSIIITYTDLRTTPSKLLRYDFDWQPNLSALQVLERILGETPANEIEAELKNKFDELIVSWYNKSTDKISEIGGVGTLKWAIQDNTILTISYTNSSTTQQQIDEVLDWTSAQGI